MNIPCPKVRCGVPGVSYVAFRRNGGFPSTTFQCEMRFTAVDCDPDSGEPDGGDGTEDVFPLEAFEVSASDFMAKVTVPNFRTSWEVRGNCKMVRTTHPHSAG